LPCAAHLTGETYQRVAREARITLKLEKVDISTKRTESGTDFLEINPKGSVPVLELSDGERLTEGPAIAQYLADMKPESELAPINGTKARYRLQEWLGFINSDLYKTYSALFNPATPELVRSERKCTLLKYYALLEHRLSTQPWLLGNRFSAADAYLFTVTNWAPDVGLDISKLTGIPSSSTSRRKARGSGGAASRRIA
jgi:glutathione S-transferase